MNDQWEYKEGAYGSFTSSSVRRATIRCGRCGVPMNGEDMSSGHICDDRLGEYELD